MNNLIYLNQAAIKFHTVKVKKFKKSKLHCAVETVMGNLEFESFEVLKRAAYGKVNKIGIHLLIEDIDELEYQIQDAIETLERDNYPTIYIYV